MPFRSTPLPLAALCVTCAATAGGAAALFATGPAAVPPGVPVAAVGTAATAADARELSGVFRTVARNVMPAVVAVEAVSPSPRRSNRPRMQMRRFPNGGAPQLDRAPQLDGSPFDEPFFRRFFENDPRLREMLENGEWREVAPGQFQNFQNGGVPDGGVPDGGVPGGFGGWNFHGQMPRSAQVRSGSGAVIDGRAGLILTNSHVVNGAESVTVRFEDGSEYATDDVLTDPDSDVAVLRLNPDDLPKGGLPEVPLGDSGRTAIGDWVLAFGSPLDQRFSMTAGIVSGEGRTAGLSARENYLQHDAAINPGNSGGPLVNLDGQIVGVNTAISSRGGGYDGIGFAVPSNDAKWVVDQLLENGEVTRAFLGVFMQELDGATADALGLAGDGGVLVNEVIAGSPAERAGVEAGDVIRGLDGAAVTDTRQLMRLVEKLSVGEDYPLVVVRDGAETNLTLTAGDATDAPSARRAERRRPRRGDRGEASEATAELPGFGLRLTPLTDAWRDRLDLGDDVTGAVVTASRGPAAEAGVRAGSVLLKLGRESLADAGGDRLSEIAAAVPAGENLLVYVLDPRTGRKRFETVEPDDAE